MSALRKFVWALGLIGAACVLGFGVRVWLLGGADARSLQLAFAGAGLLLTYAALDRDRLDDVARRRDVRHGGAAWLVVLGAALAGGLLYAGVRRVDQTVDLTEGRRFTPSAHTLSVLDGLDQDVQILAFFVDGSSTQKQFARVVRAYTERSARLSLSWIDPVKEPLKAREHQIEVLAGEVVITQGERSETLAGRFDESALTDALVRVTSDKVHVVCWTEGHGEADPDDTRDASGMGDAVLALEGANVQVLHANTLAGRLDPRCEAVVIARPTVDWLAYERRLLLGYLRGGGRVLALLEPGVTPALAASFASVGVAVGDDLVLDPSPDRAMPGAGDASRLVVPPRAFDSHPITDGLRGAALLSVARSVGLAENTPGVAARVLLRAGTQSWAEADLGDDSRTYARDPDEAQGELPLAVASELITPEKVPLPELGASVGVDEAEVRDTVTHVLTSALGDRPLSDSLRLDQDLGLSADGVDALRETVGDQLGVSVASEPALDTVGALVTRATEAAARRVSAQGDAVAVAAPEPKAGGRLVVFGDASFAQNRSLAFGSDRELFLDAVAWLTGEDDQLGERPDDMGDTLTMNATQEGILAVFALLLVPGAAGALALGTLLRRRSL
jgi:hypothetical protein